MLRRGWLVSLALVAATSIFGATPSPAAPSPAAPSPSVAPTSSVKPPQPAWKSVGKGVDYAALRPEPPFAEAEVHVVRVDPSLASLRVGMASALDRKSRTAGAWCDAQRLLATINLGMFHDDRLRNVGYARSGEHVNHGRWVSKYHSVLVIGPKRPGLKPAAVLDLDAPGSRELLPDYETVVQNLRLIRAPGQNVWGQGPRRWSEAAVAMDKGGRILFVFVRRPYNMHDFNRILLGLPLGVVAAMHAEGGPEASLSVRGPLRLDLNGSYETGFVEDERIVEQWPIPNVLGVTAREPAP